MSSASGIQMRHCCEESAADRAALDADSARWLDALCGAGRDEAVRELHELLLRVARRQVSRSRGHLRYAGATDLAELAEHAADDATVAVLDRLASYAGRARFTTWAYKFAIVQTAVAMRRAAWLGREIPVEPTAWPLTPDNESGPEGYADAAALAAALRTAIAEQLTPHQRLVLVSLAVNDVPVDVLAQRLGTTRGALYKTLHDARGRLRAALTAAGFDVDAQAGRSRG